eukprot:CAMPEP_0194179736 /NCGR_PEP_ID=MMETSP0154-20130528/13144_1 /TAXON_ID=1049557 /ORGANISM="Thalassiothrix antarctica, Strain L6-D1" /LENGTH=543 /DNA_ID=CAMNT_0038895193 /DNA_START=28 /DNA_END=1659 /DNA_ORIENTATION=-
MPRHEKTTECATGIGSKVAKKQKVKAGKSNIWNPDVCYNINIVPEEQKTKKKSKQKSKTKPSSSSRKEATNVVVSTLQLPPPPSCSVEVLRMISSNHLRKQLTKLRKSHRNPEDAADSSMKHAVMAVERWFMRYFLQNPVTTDEYDADPVIPCPSDDMEIDPGFVKDLEAAGDTEEAAGTVVKTFYKLSKTAALAISKKRKAMSECNKKSLENVVVVHHRHSCDVMLSTNKKNLLKINPVHYEKLKVMYTRQLQRKQLVLLSNEKEVAAYTTFDVSEFHRRLFCVLARYHSIQGHGFQAACTEHVFDVLHTHFGVNLECFASPLNSRYARYCSAFPDTDACFGSLGSFFNFYPTAGSFQANPPFEPALMLAMVQHMERLFSNNADNNDGPLSFIVVVPGWKECEAFQLLQSSAYLQTAVPIAQSDHGFCDGASHQRRDRYQISPYDTFFFFLQNDKAVHKWPIKDGAISELKVAMAHGVPSPSMQARHDKAGRGTSDIARGVYKGKKSRATGDGVMKRKREELLLKKKKRQKVMSGIKIKTGS